MSEVDGKGNVLSTFTDTESPQYLTTDKTGHHFMCLYLSLHIARGLLHLGLNNLYCVLCIVNCHRWPASMGVSLLWQPAINVITIVLYCFTVVVEELIFLLA